MAETVSTIPDGVQLPLDSLPATIVTVDGFTSTITVSYQSKTYVQTFTNDGTSITGYSGWVLTP